MRDLAEASVYDGWRLRCSSIASSKALGRHIHHRQRLQQDLSWKQSRPCF